MSASYIIINGSIAKAVNLPIIAPKSGGSNGLQSVVNMPGLVSIHQPQSTSESQNQNKPKSVVRKPKSTLFGLKWSEEEIIKFLQNYREHECLWDISHEHYRNKLARHVAYKDLRDDMEMPGLTVDGVINKIKSMRTTYKAELNKITRHNKHNVGEPPYKPNLFWFDMADEFLRTTYEIREIGDSKSEAIKFPLRNYPGSIEAKNICRILLLSLDTSLRTLAPFMPVLTQHLHQHLPRIWNVGEDKGFPKVLDLRNEPLEKDVEKVLEVVVAVRRLKKIFNITAKHEREAILVSTNKDLLSKYAQTVADLAFLNKLEIAETLPDNRSDLIKDVAGETTIFYKVPVDLRKSLEADLPKMEAKRVKLLKDLEKMDKMISGEGYAQKATSDAQAAHLKKVTTLKEQIARINYIQEISKS